MTLKSVSTKRRNEGEILLDVLRAVYKEPLGPTNLMFKSNMSWKMLKKRFLPPLLMLKLLIFVKDEKDNRSRGFYELTKRGEIITNACRKYKIITFALGRLVMNIPKERRSKLDLMIDILSATKQKQRITALLELTGMSYKSLLRYLEILRQGNLVMVLGKKGEHPEYITTENGLRLIELYENATLYIIQLMRQESLDASFARHVDFSKVA